MKNPLKNTEPLKMETKEKKLLLVEINNKITNKKEELRSLKREKAELERWKGGKN